MALDRLNITFSGKDEHDKFILELTRKYALLDTLHDEVINAHTVINANTGYDKIDEMIEQINPVKIEIETLASEIRTTASNLES